MRQLVIGLSLKGDFLDKVQVLIQTIFELDYQTEVIKSLELAKILFSLDELNTDQENEKDNKAILEQLKKIESNCLDGIPLDEAFELYQNYSLYPFSKKIKYAPKGDSEARTTIKPHELKKAFKTTYFEILRLIFNSKSLESGSFGFSGKLPSDSDG
jgi:hypothetical protein